MISPRVDWRKWDHIEFLEIDLRQFCLSDSKTFSKRIRIRERNYLSVFPAFSSSTALRNLSISTIIWWIDSLKFPVSLISSSMCSYVIEARISSSRVSWISTYPLCPPRIFLFFFSSPSAIFPERVNSSVSQYSRVSAPCKKSIYDKRD